MNWYTYITPPRSVTALFEGIPPSLDQLLFHELRVRPTYSGEDFFVLLEWPLLPANSPAKWKAKGHKALQLLLTLRGCSAFEKTGIFTGRPVSVEIEASRFAIFEQGNGAKLVVVPHAISAQFFPYSGDFQHNGVGFSSSQCDV